VSWEAQRGVWAHSTAKGNTLLTLLAIADFLNRESHMAWPAVSTLAKKTRQTERNVRYALKKLRESGEITIIEGAGPAGCNCYTINLPYDGRPEILPLQRFQGAKISGGKGSTSDPAKISANLVNPNLEIDNEIDPLVVQLELELWTRVLDRVRQRVPRDTFDQWLRQTQLTQYEKGHLVVQVPSSMAADFLSTRIMPLIEVAAGEETGEACVIEFRVA
jgi:hypothetical protein